MLGKNLGSVLWPAILGLLLSLSLNHFTDVYSAHAAYSLVYFCATCFVFNLVYAARRRQPNFSDLLFGGIVVRLLLALVIVLVYGLLLRSALRNFAAHFVGHYILFTIFEIRFLIWLIRQPPSHQQP